MITLRDLGSTGASEYPYSPEILPVRTDISPGSQSRHSTFRCKQIIAPRPAPVPPPTPTPPLRVWVYLRIPERQAEPRALRLSLAGSSIFHAKRYRKSSGRFSPATPSPKEVFRNVLIPAMLPEFNGARFSQSPYCRICRKPARPRHVRAGIFQVVGRHGEIVIRRFALPIFWPTGSIYFHSPASTEYSARLMPENPFSAECAWI